MRVLRIPRSKFILYRNSFHRNCLSATTKCDITKITHSKSDGFSAFVGDSKRMTETKTLPCLFDFEAVGSKREKYGIAEDIDAVIYISQQSLKESFKLDKFTELPNKHYPFKVTFKNESFIIDSVNYLEEMYGMCVAIQLKLKSDKKGG